MLAACGTLCWVAVLPLVAHAASTGWSLQPAADLASFPAPEATTSLVEPAQSCDPSWCSCKHHYCQSKDDEEEDGPGCDLCSQKWVFVFSAGGRTGSTSLLEGLNALPGISLTGENFAVLNDLQATYAKVNELVRRNKKNKDVAAFFLPKTHGMRKQTLCAQQAIMAGLAGAALVNRSSESEENVWSGDQIYGFKELVEPPSSDVGAAFEGEFPHFSIRQRVRCLPKVLFIPFDWPPALPVFRFSSTPST